ncbi:glycosyltransferase family 4 protein [Patescibacteria group bacterium]
MIIGIDGNEANIENRAGVNHYAYEILWGLYKLQDTNNGRHKFIVYLKDLPRKDLPKEKDNWSYMVLPGRKLWIITKLMPHLLTNKEKIDVLYSPSHYTVPFSLLPRVCSIMDLGYLKFSEQFNKTTFWQLKYWSAISIYVSKYVIAISNATKKDIVRHYPSARKKVKVTHLAYDKKRFNTNVGDNDVRRIKSKYHIVDDYVLFLSTLKPSKNLEGLMIAFSGLRDKFPTLKLIIAGKKGWMYEEIFNKVKELGIEDNVIFTGYFDEEDKPALYKGAKVIAAPSFWEGFGLHVLESMACGTPAVVGDVGSIPEVVGDAGVLVDPESTDSIQDGLEGVLSMDEKGYNKLVDRGIKKAISYSWDKTAKKTLNILESVKK